MSNKKRDILIVFTGSMELGGIERSLLGLLDAIDYGCYNVDLFLYGHHGPLFSLINSKVNILPEVKELAYLRESLKEKFCHRCFYSATLRVRDEIFKRLHIRRRNHSWAQVMRKYAPKLDKHYDMAISFFLPFDYILEKVDADVKVGWIHTDYSSEKANLKELEQQYDKVDKIVAVSEQCKQVFIKLFPQFENKTVVIENILSKSYIYQQAQHTVDMIQSEQDTERKILLSIGRFCEQKNFDNIPDICKRILQDGCDIKWYLIGYGSDEDLIRRKVAEAGMENHVIILGKKENPYPYIKMCNIYVQPSRYEGKCVAVREAQILEKPVVITKYATSESQLEDGVDGIIVPMDNEGCAKAISSLLRNDEKMSLLGRNCRKREYTNINEVEKVYSLIK